MTGAFAQLQGLYAAHRVATYPLDEDKTPAIRGYDRVGTGGSAQLALRFPAAMAAGFVAGRRNRLTIADVDSTDERLVEEIEGRFGATPLAVRTPSGGWHLYYRHAGEARRIRPLPDVDILGAGNVVAALSIVPKGRYQIVRGTLDDLASLPTMRQQPNRPAHAIPNGKRNDTMFRHALRQARYCDDLDGLLDVVRTMNMECEPPLPDEEIVTIVKSAWGYEIGGRNWVGRHARASTDRDEILALCHDPAAALLLSLLRVSHPTADERFAIDQVETARLLGWDRARLRAKIEALIAAGRLARVHCGKGKGDPHLYQLRQGPADRGGKTTTI